jgi:S-adenosylmethionine:tRNA ribosyltransferase-isomerase
MDLEEFDYALPESLIAAYPSREREAARLLVVDRKSGALTHSVFAELGDFLEAGDLLVLNDTKVFPARLRGAKESGGKVEVLLIERFPKMGLLIVWSTQPRSLRWKPARLRADWQRSDRRLGMVDLP